MMDVSDDYGQTAMIVTMTTVIVGIPTDGDLR